MIRHVFWDFDGTLFDSYPHMARSFQRALADVGHDTPLPEVMARIKRSVGGCIAHYEALYNVPGTLHALYRKHETRDVCDDVRPYDGLEPLLHATRGAGICHYVYTHRGRSALAYLERFGLLTLFEDAVTGADGFAPKPAPDALLHLMAKHTIAPGTALMVGDRDIDILCARNAGMAACLFDPEHYYDAFAHPFRIDALAALQTVLLAPSAQPHQTALRGPDRKDDRA